MPTDHGSRGRTPDDNDNPSPSAFIHRLAKLPVRPHGVRESVLVEPATRYPLKAETRAAQRKRHRALTRQERHHQRRLDRGEKRVGDWREVLRLLARRTLRPPDPPSPPPTNPPEVSVRIDVASSDSVADKESDQSPVHSSSGAGRQRERSVVSAFVLPRRFRLETRAGEIPRPTTWTSESFDQYVAALTGSVVPRDAAARVYAETGSHAATVAPLLLRLFRERAALPFISDTSVKMALSYLCRHGSCYGPARSLFQSLAWNGFTMDLEVHHIMLEGAVKVENLAEFQSLLKHMVNLCGISPTLWTWILFLRMINAEEVKRYILHFMNAAGLLHGPTTMMHMAEELTGHDIYRAIQLGYDIETFIAKQTALYGAVWLTPSSGNKVLQVLASYSKWDDVAQFLGFMFASRHAQPDRVTLKTIMTHCRYQLNEEQALRFLRLFERHGIGRPHLMVWRMLFSLAFHGGRPHMFGVLWRYAHYVNPHILSYYELKKGWRLLSGDAGGARRLIRRLIALSDEQGLQLDANATKAFRRDLLLSDYKRFGFVDADPAGAPTDVVETGMLGGHRPADEVSEDEPDEADNSGDKSDNSSATNGADGRKQMLLVFRMMQLFYSRQRFAGYRPVEPLSEALEKALQKDVQMLQDLGRGVMPSWEVAPLAVQRDKAFRRSRRRVRPAPLSLWPSAVRARVSLGRRQSGSLKRARLIDA